MLCRITSSIGSSKASADLQREQQDPRREDERVHGNCVECSKASYTSGEITVDVEMLAYKGVF